MVKRVRFGVRHSLLTCLGALGAGWTAAAAQPNIVVVVTDDQRRTRCRTCRPSGASLPARRSPTNAFVTNPFCCPSRASILTGAYSHSTASTSNAFRTADSSLVPRRLDYRDVLDGAGYETALVGKYLNGYSGSSYVLPGWDRWVALTPPGYYRYGYDIDGIDGAGRGSSHVLHDFLAQEALSFVEAAPRPFFLYLAPYAPHAAATPAQRHASAFPDVPPGAAELQRGSHASDKPPWVRAILEWNRARRASVDGLRPGSSARCCRRGWPPRARRRAANWPTPSSCSCPTTASSGASIASPVSAIRTRRASASPSSSATTT